MKQQITFKSLLVVICLLLSFNLQAQIFSDTINVTAGNLSTQLGDQKDLITNLTLTGEINGYDIRTLRSMVKLSILNMANANIVTGGNFYVGDLNINVTNNHIPEYMFYPLNDLSNITSIIMPNSVTSIGNSAFAGCTVLSSFVFGNSITSIGYSAFADCPKLTTIIIPNTVTSIGMWAFGYCSGLTSISIPNSVTSSIGRYTFIDCTRLTSITIPSNVTSIDDYAFSGCTALTSITIGNRVTSIGSSAFYGCTGLTSVTIPNNVVSIGSYAFYDCTGLTEIHCKTLTPPITSSTVFSGVNKKLCKLYVPKGSYAVYWNALGWWDFTNIVEEELTSIFQTKANNIKVYSEQDAIIVTGVELGDVISVYSDSGALLQSTKVADDIVRIKVPTSHIYFVKTTNKAFKVAL